MLDCGTKAEDYAILKLYKYMENHDDCGGCCGEIEVEMNDMSKKLEKRPCPPFFWLQELQLSERP